MKKSISLVLAVLLIFAVTTITAFALPSSDDVISFDEYYSELKSEYAKYNIVLTIEEPNLNFVYTRALLDKELEAARSMDQSIHTLTEDELEQYAAHKEAVAENATGSMPTALIQASFTPVRYSYGFDHTIYWEGPGVSFGYQKCTVSCTGEVNIENGQVISRNASARKVSGVNVNSVNIYATSYLSGIKVTLVLDGEVDFKYTDPVSNTTFSGTVYGPFAMATFTPENELGG